VSSTAASPAYDIRARVEGEVDMRVDGAGKQADIVTQVEHVSVRGGAAPVVSTYTILPPRSHRKDGCPHREQGVGRDHVRLSLLSAAD
jgi:hypothetical protein